MQKRLLLACLCAFILSCGSGGDSTSNTEQAQITDQTQTTPEWVGRWWFRTIRGADYSEEGSVASFTTKDFIFDFRYLGCQESGELLYTGDNVTLMATINTCGTGFLKYVALFSVSGETLTGTFSSGSGGVMTWTRLVNNEEPPAAPVSAPPPSGGTPSGGGDSGGSQICSSSCASSGACSSHDGVDCSAGPDSDGSVICNDGWRGSSVEYSCN